MKKAVGDEEFMESWKKMDASGRRLADELYAHAQAARKIDAKTKRLILLAIATAQHDGCSCRCYARDAKALGATKEECFEAVQLVLELAGIGAFSEGVDAVNQVFG